MLHIQLHIRLDVIMEVNSMNADQTVPLVAFLFRAILLAERLHKKTTKVVTGGKTQLLNNIDWNAPKIVCN